MRNKIQHIASIIVTFIFLTYIVGIEVNHHICATYGRETVDIFKKGECEHHKKISCHHCKPKPKCCNENFPKDKEHKGISESCCTEFTTTFIIDNDFHLNNNGNSVERFLTIDYVLPNDNTSKETFVYINSKLPLPRDKIAPSNHILRYIYYSSLSKNEDFVFFS
jgi:hypothetical protein